MPDVMPVIANATVGKRTFFQRIFVVKHFLIGAMIAFVVLAILIRNIPFFQFDLTITRFVQSINIPMFRTLMLILTFLGNPIPASIAIFLVSGSLFLLKKKYVALFTLISSLGASAIGFVAKDLVARPRPDSLLITQLGRFVKPDSFPSGHVLHYIGLYGFIFVFIFTKFRKSQARYLILLSLVVLLVGIGLSRIYVGAHWFSDVLGSYLIGSVWLYYMAYLYNKYEKKSVKK